MTSDREYVEGTRHIFAPPEYDEVNDAIDGLRVRLLAALEREEKLREALDAIADEAIETEIARFARKALGEPHGNFEDTQDTNPEGGC